MAPVDGSQHMPSPPPPSLSEKIKKRKIKQEKSCCTAVSLCYLTLKRLVPLPQEKSFPGDPHFLGEGLFGEMDLCGTLSSRIATAVAFHVLHW